MDPVSYLRAMRRRWGLVVLAVVVSLGGGFAFVSLDGGTDQPSYTATAFLLDTTPLTSDRAEGLGGRVGSSELNTLASLVTLGEVPDRVARELGFEGDPERLVRMVKADANRDTGLLRIAATAGDPDRAKDIADAFATQLIEYLTEQDAEALAEQIEEKEALLADADREIQTLERRIRKKNEKEEEEEVRRLEAQLSAKLQAREQTASALRELQAQEPGTGGLAIIQRASVGATEAEPFQGPLSDTARVAIAGGLGLLAGIVIALVLDRFDTRIRTRQAAEQAFSLPVLGEIPPIPRSQRRRIVAAERPKSLHADAFRLLGAGVTRAGLDGREDGDKRTEPPRTILVTSAGPSEGKTTVVANLAAIFAEMGKKVLVVSCDFHRPNLHRLFGVNNGPGLSEALRSPDGQRVLEAKVLTRTRLKDVALVTSGPVTGKPGELLGSNNMRRALRESRRLADVVLLDSAPILVANDAAYLVSEVDAVLIAAYAGKTTAELADRAGQLLRRLGAPVVGVVLNGVSEIVLPRRYRKYYRSEEKDVRSEPEPARSGEPSGPEPEPARSGARDV